MKIVRLTILLMLFSTNMQAQLQATTFKTVYTMERKANLDYPFLWTVNDSLVAYLLESRGSSRMDTIRIINLRNELLHEVTVPMDIRYEYPLLKPRIVDNSLYFFSRNMWFKKKQKSFLLLYKYSLSDKTLVPLTVPASLFPDKKLALSFRISYIDEVNKVAYLFDFNQKHCLKYDLLNNTASLFTLPSIYSIDETYVANGVLFFCDYGSTYKLTDKEDGLDKSYIRVSSITETNNASVVYYPAVNTPDNLNIIRQPDGSGEVCLNGKLYAFNSKGFVPLSKPAPVAQVQSNRLQYLQKKLFAPNKRGLILVAGNGKPEIDTLKIPNEFFNVYHVDDKQIVVYDPDKKADINFKEVKAVKNEGNTNPTSTESDEPDRFPYSEDFFIKLMKQYVKERDELNVSFNRYSECISRGKTKSDCEFYFPVGGKGRAEKLLKDCKEYSALLERYRADFTRIVGESYETTRKVFDFDETRLNQMIKLFK